MLVYVCVHAPIMPVHMHMQIICILMLTPLDSVKLNSGALYNTMRIAVKENGHVV